MQKWKIAVISSVVILTVITYGGLKVYGAGYAGGNADGYQSGYAIGRDEGYTSGKEDGYQTGYGEGQTAGFASGKTEGYNLGKNEGYNTGQEVGYEQGYDAGVKAGAGQGYTIKDLTYQEVVTFLTQDKTDLNRYVEPTYVCSHFARDVCNNAENEGIRCAYVELRYPSSAHTLVAFNTVDRGLVYFEPQTDEKVIPVIGKRYYQCIEPRPGFLYPEPSYDDTIKDILVIW
jgi:hypothetical protein